MFSPFCSQSGRRSPRQLRASADASSAFSTPRRRRATGQAKIPRRGAGTSKPLPKQSRLSRGHHAAMPYGTFRLRRQALRARSCRRAALDFAILTAARSGEVLGAGWSEIDLGAKVWTVPAERMKAAREHSVPLSERAVEIFGNMDEAKVSDFVFPGQRGGRPLSVMALEMVLSRMGIEDTTVHGFRSAFRDWAGNETHFPREFAEHALAHVIGDKAEQAYRRSDALMRRRELWTLGRAIAKARRARTCWRSSGRRERSVAPRSALDPERPFEIRPVNGWEGRGSGRRLCPKLSFLGRQFDRVDLFCPRE